MILDDIVEKKQIRLKEHKSRIHPAEMIRLADEAQASGGNFYQALKKPGISIIGIAESGKNPADHGADRPH